MADYTIWRLVQKSSVRQQTLLNKVGGVWARDYMFSRYVHHMMFPLNQALALFLIERCFPESQLIQYTQSFSLFNFLINAEERCVHAMCVLQQPNSDTIIVVGIYIQTCTLNFLSTSCDMHPVTSHPVPQTNIYNM